MSVLSDKAIFEAIEKGYFSITPLVANNIQPASIDLTLYNIIDILPEISVDLHSNLKEILDKSVSHIDITDGYILSPGDIVTGYSAEILKFSSFINGRLFNRNSLAQYGIDAASGNYINPGFSGRMPIVIKNCGHCTMKIYPGIRICQLEISSLETRASRGYNERHDANAIVNEARRLSGYVENISGRDTSLNDFLNQRIKEVSGV